MESQLLDQAQKVRDLARRLDELSPQNVARTETPDVSFAQRQNPEEEPSVEKSESELIEETTSNESTQTDAIADKPKAFEPQPPKFIASSSVGSFEKFKSLAEWEALIGGNVLNRIGALALILGIGFFLKYAFDNDLISPAMRALIGAAIGAGLIAGGARAHSKKLEIFAQGLFGAGISALYLSIYAAFNFYQLLPQGVAFVLMSVVTAMALLIATRCDSLAISVLGWAGGFLTPFLLATAEPNAVGLFVYLALLNLGMLALTLVKAEWVIIEPLSIVATYFVYAIWLATSGDKAETLVVAFFLTLFWSLFLASEAYRAFQNDVRKFRLRAMASAMNAVFYFGCLYASVTPSAWFALWTAAIAAVYFALFVALRKRSEAMAKELLATYSVGAIGFVAAAIEVGFGDFLTVASWSALAAFVLWLARREEGKTLERIAFILYGITMVRLFISPDALSYQAILDFKPILNLRVVAFLSLALSLFFGARLIRQTNPSTAIFFDYAWCFIAFALLTIEVNDVFLMREAQLGEELGFSRSTRRLSFGVVWLFYAVALLWLGAKNSARSLVNVGLFVLALGVLWNLVFGFRFEPIEVFLPILNVRALSFLLVIGGIALSLSLLKQTGEGESGTAQALRYAFVVALFLLLTTEALDYFRWVEWRSQSDESFRRALTLALLWTLYAAPMLYFGIKANLKPLFYAGLCAFAISTLALLVEGFFYEPIENFSLGLNYRVAAYLALMSCGAFIAIWLSKEPDWRKLSTAFGIVAALMGALLLVAEFNDFFEQKIDRLSYGEHAEATTIELRAQCENQKQLSISASLTLYSIALMLYGIWRARQPIRLAAIGLFGLAILKIFIYDLSFLDTLYRIFSFIGLGALLLLASYLYQRYKHLILGAT
ncbi:MAG: DUF2339 domain-containing protein [Chloroherpetonaceae bacterium]|nr:DUF2339 domain-containing protein [Chloroherpetonaceae bacterium]MDW8438610.1 DUF2339 domain-containing protein [Chloroherpetonaceae bacterium]